MNKGQYSPLDPSIQDIIKQKAEELEGFGATTIRRALEKDGHVVNEKTIRKYWGDHTSVVLDKMKSSLTNIVKKAVSSLKWEEDNEGAVISATSEARTLDEFVELYKIDLEKWDIIKHVVNQWGQEGVRPDGSIVKPSFQIKVWLKPKVHEIDALEAFEKIKKAMKKEKAPDLKVYKHKSGKGLLEVNIFDPHIGKMCWLAETDNNYDIKIAEKLFLNTIKDFLQKTQGYEVERILFPIGNDLFHIDTKMNTTTGGTFQDVDGRHQKVFEAGCTLLIKAIELMRSVAPVDVVVIPGNHDELATMHAGVVLNAYFRNDKSVDIENEPKMRKYYKYHNSLIGMTHGNQEKLADLPLIMAQEATQWWAETAFRYFRLAHFHHRKKQATESMGDYKGVQITTGKSISGVDAWHKGKGYVGSIRGAEAYFHAKGEGVVAEFSHNISTDKELFNNYLK